MDKRLLYITELQALAQTGLTYADGPFDRERYERLLQLTTEMAEELTGTPSGEVLDIFHEESRYKTPSIDVRAAVIQDDKILMVQESNDLWTLPGGWCEVNLSAKDNVEKEVLEETGLQVNAHKLVAFYDKLKQDHPPQWPHSYKCFFLCDITGGELLASTLEAQATGFFALDALPPLCAHRATARQIERCFVHHKTSELPTEFD